MAETRKNQVLITDTELSILKAIRSIDTGKIEVVKQQGGIHLVNRNAAWKPGTPDAFPVLSLN